MMAHGTAALMIGALVLSPGLSHAGTPLEIRGYPDTLHEYEIDAQHGMNSLLLQNLAIVNTGSDSIVIDRVVLIVRADASALQQITLDAADLDRSAARGAGLQQAGVMSGMDFQFNSAELLGVDDNGIDLAKTRALGARQSLLVLYKLFSYRGHAQAVEVEVSGKDAQGSTFRIVNELPVSKKVVRGLRFPLRGTSYIANSPSLHSAHRWAVIEEFAYDIIRVGSDGRSHRGKGTRRTDYHAYGAPVLAAKAGRVVAVVNDVKETDDMLRKEDEASEAFQQRILQQQAELLSRGVEAAAGNYVLIEQGEAEYALYAHLATGTVRVAVGDAVTEGHVLARLGTSGSSTEPHLHFQVCDKPSFTCASIPTSFERLRINFADGPRALQTGDFVTSD